MVIYLGGGVGLIVLRVVWRVWLIRFGVYCMCYFGSILGSKVLFLNRRKSGGIFLVGRIMELIFVERL